MSELESPVALETLADLLEHLGGIPAARVRLHPPSGTATAADVLNLYDHEDRLCELVDGALVEQAMGFRESYLAGDAAEASGVPGGKGPRDGRF